MTPQNKYTEKFISLMRNIVAEQEETCYETIVSDKIVKLSNITNKNAMNNVITGLNYYHFTQIYNLIKGGQKEEYIYNDIKEIEELIEVIDISNFEFIYTIVLQTHKKINRQAINTKEKYMQNINLQLDGLFAQIRKLVESKVPFSYGNTALKDDKTIKKMPFDLSLVYNEMA